MEFAHPPTTTGRLDVDGCAIAWAAWGEATTLPILLVHGGGAQIGWWDEVAGELQGHHRVLALDLSGAGHSGWREAYDGPQWGRECAAVAERVGGGPALIVGHSMGGRIAVLAAAAHPQTLLGPVLIDSPVRRPDPAHTHGQTPDGVGTKTYPDRETAVRAFHLRPHEPVRNSELLMRLAADMFRLGDDGAWIPRADPEIYRQISDFDVADALAAIPGPISHLYGERSAVVSLDTRDFIAEHHPGATTSTAVREGFHHLTFDHAGAVAACIEAAWRAIAAAQP